jgi:hypothetical protein
MDSLVIVQLQKPWAEYHQKLVMMVLLGKRRLPTTPPHRTRMPVTVPIMTVQTKHQN